MLLGCSLQKLSIGVQQAGGAAVSTVRSPCFPCLFQGLLLVELMGLGEHSEVGSEQDEGEWSPEMEAYLLRLGAWASDTGSLE